MRTEASAALHPHLRRHTVKAWVQHESKDYIWWRTPHLEETLESFVNRLERMLLVERVCLDVSHRWHVTLSYTAYVPPFARSEHALLERWLQ